MAKRALIVVDPQNDFYENGSLAVPGSNRIMPVINQLMENGVYDAVVITQDWHPANHSSFEGWGGIWPVHCVAGSFGAEVHPMIEEHRADLIIRKGRQITVDSYSAFMENDRKTPTGLHGYLNARGITNVAICGLAKDYCVNYTATDAAMLGFRVSVLGYATVGISSKECATAEAVWRQLGIEHIK